MINWDIYIYYQTKTRKVHLIELVIEMTINKVNNVNVRLMHVIQF